MTYEESAALAKDLVFQGRVKIAALRVAVAVLAEDPATPAHIARWRRAIQWIAQPDYEAQQLQPLVVIDPAVDAAGAAIADGALQTAVEGVFSRTL
jgi:hypothetical protein